MKMISNSSVRSDSTKQDQRSTDPKGSGKALVESDSQIGAEV